MQENYQKLANALKSASILLKLDKQSGLFQDINSIGNYLANDNFRIAVFGPFNHGKSTLLNAILGSKTLPIDLIPTTGAAITVKYGSDVRTRIMLRDGTEIYRAGIDVLKQFAILDGDRRMRNDVAFVEVFCPNSFLATGVEFLDLPGTNDREEQDNLVREQLLGSDLVIQLLDARKLMTLGERENLRDWLLERGIKTVIFVANFLNLLEPEEQKQVYNRLLFVAESFRAELPPGFSNLYRVDALPALRARLKGDVSAATSSGVVAFETALQNIASILQKNRQSVRSPRVQAIALQLQQSLKAKIYPIQNEIKAFDEKHNAKIEIQQRAEKLIKQGFSVSVKKLRDWLDLSNLTNKYAADAAVALAQNNFKSWLQTKFKADFIELETEASKWLNQAYEFFRQERPENLQLLISFPSEPSITLPPKPSNSGDLGDAGSLAVGSGIGWLVGGPLGAAVVGSITYMVNKNIQQQDSTKNSNSYHQQVAKLCLDAANNYFARFSNQALSILTEYEIKSDKVIRFQSETEPVEITQKRDDLERFQHSLYTLNRQLETNLGITIPKELDTEKPTPKPTPKSVNPPQSVYRHQGVGVKEYLGQQSTAKNSPPPPVSPSPSPSPPPPKKEELEAKFQALEFDDEIARMKAQMSAPGYKIPKPNQYQAQNQTNTPPKQSKKQAEQEAKIARAYTILGLQKGASSDDIKKAYRDLVKKWHPDLFVNQPQLLKQAESKMLQFNEAYNLLTNSL